MWPLPSSELVEIILFQIEVCVSILECESTTLTYYCTSDSGITGVEGDSLALLISNSEVHGVGVVCVQDSHACWSFYANLCNNQLITKNDGISEG